MSLAQVPPFRLGGVLVDPPRRRVSAADREILLEPRVMEVLVVLAEARGAVISRDELIDRCWGGRIVGDNAINRVISRIRQVGTELGMDSFQLETITKVGYRMVIRDRDEPAAAGIESGEPIAGQDDGDRTPARPSRRNLLAAGGAAAVAAAAGGWLWLAPGRHRPHPEALDLYQRGQIAQKQGLPEQTRQAVSFLKRATEIDPLYADAWGGLALAYRHILEGFAEAEIASMPGLIESAARRALELDPRNGDAQVALVLIRPTFRNWRTVEAELLRLEAHHPDHWFVQAQLGIVRYETGRWRDGLPHTERQLEVEPLIPIPHVVRARALWSLGRLQEAEAVLDSAIRRWPAYYPLWQLKFTFLLFSGRPGSALAFVMDPETQPENLRPNAIEMRAALVRAIEHGTPRDVATSLEDMRQQMAAAVGSAANAAPVFARLGRSDLALLAIERYLFGGPDGELGPAVPGPVGLERRFTSFLFLPPLAPLWSDRRFLALLERVGLELYWRESRTLPDHRRRA